MKRLIVFAAVQMALVGAAWAQSSTVMVRFTTSCGKYLVDGVQYSTGSTFLWPLGSQHTYQTAPSYPISDDIMCVSPSGYGFSGVVPVTVSDSYVTIGWNVINYLNGSVTYDIGSTKEYRVRAIVMAFEFTPPPSGCVGIALGDVQGGASASLLVPVGPTDTQFSVGSTTPGSGGEGFPNPPFSAMIDTEIVTVSKIEPDDYQGLWIWTVSRPATGATSHQGGTTIYAIAGNGNAGTCVTDTGEIWVPEGGSFQVRAIAPPGQVFDRWIGELQAFGSTPVVTVTLVNAPWIVRAQFVMATPVMITTDPPNLKVLVDQSPVITPVSFNWKPGSVHALSPVDRQVIGGTGPFYVFSSWADGGDPNRQVTIPDTRGTVVYQANYAVGVPVGFNTVPTGLKLIIDGRSNLPDLRFLWAPGSKHTIAAPADQTMGGRAYTFNHWTTGDPISFEYTVPAEGQTMASNAVYDVLGQLRIESVPSGLRLMVDNAPCLTPCVINRKAGTQVAVAATPALIIDSDTKQVFQNWSDGGSIQRVWTAGTTVDTLRANYSVNYHVQFSSDPAGGGRFTATPASTDGYYPAGTNLTVTATANDGFKFKYWTYEDLVTPLDATQQVWVYGPMAMQASFDEVPSITSVTNVVGPTPEAVVAPGSLISINGHLLAAAQYIKGPENPLAQTIGNVVAMVDDRLLPLIFVSPSRIDGQLPSGITEGDHTVKVSGVGQPTVTGTVSVKRNAPGLFNSTVSGQHFIQALHQDGSPITADSPALRNETITLLGTGFGPYTPQPVDGFILPANWVSVLADPVEIRVGDSQVLQPDSVRAAVGYVGMTAVKLTITNALPAATTVELRVAVKIPGDPDGKFRESNTVLLPLQ